MQPAEPEAPLIYPAILTTEAGRTLVSFPDCPACRTFAEPGEDVLPIAQHALAGRLAAAIQDETEPPHPTSLSRLSSTERILPVPVPTDLAFQLEAKWRVSVAVAAANEGVGSWKRPIVLLWRGLRLRCPNCGGGPIFIAGTTTIVAVTSYVKNVSCAGTTGGYRIDQEDDLAFLATFGITPPDGT